MRRGDLLQLLGGVFDSPYLRSSRHDSPRLATAFPMRLCHGTLPSEKEFDSSAVPRVRIPIQAFLPWKPPGIWRMSDQFSFAEKRRM